MGLARSGLAAANLALAQGARVHVTDLKPKNQLLEKLSLLNGKVETTLGKHLVMDLLETDLIVLSPGVPPNSRILQKARSKGILVIPEVELGFHFKEGPLIGVTGSNGKTTTTSLIQEIFESAGKSVEVAGNIGTPLSKVALRCSKAGTTSVVELSSFQLETIKQFKVGISLLLNISEDHLDRHESFEAYIEAKRKIFFNQTVKDWTVLNADDAVTSAMVPQTKARVCLFSCSPLERGVWVESGQIVARLQDRKETLLSISDISIPGHHNIENVLAAVSAAHLSGISSSALREAIRGFKGVEHRLEKVADVSGVSYYNDSKSTNIESVKKALEAFPNPIVLIMGGLDKGADFTQLQDLVQRKVRALILIGKASGKIKKVLSKSTRVTNVKGLKEAVLQSSRCACRGDVVLLAPGCASFDMFKNYEHRGRVFKESVAYIVHHQDLNS